MNLKRIGKSIKKNFLAGFAIILPVGITLYLIVFMFEFLDGILGPVFRWIFGRAVPGLGLLVSLILILMVGMMATNVIGSRLIAFGEKIITGTPFVRSVYISTKQVFTTLFRNTTTNAFNRVVMVEYPRKGMYVLGFATAPASGEVQNKTKENVINIFIPTTPNPTSGFLIMVPEQDVVAMDMSVEDAIKVIISGGVLPPQKKEINE